MITDGHNKTIFDRRDTRRDTKMGEWDRRWNALRLCFSVYISLVGLFDMLFVQHDHELQYLRSLR